MKRLAVILLAAAGASVATYALVARSQQAALARQKAELQAGWERDKTALVAQRIGTARPAETREVTTTVEVPVAVGPDPAALLAKLVEVRVEGDRRRMTRRVIHYLESLVDVGQPAVPVIAAFLRQNQDVEYSSARGEGGRRGDGATNNPAREANGRERPNRDERGGGPGGGGFGGGGPGGGFGNFFAGGQGGAARLDFTSPPSLRLGLFDVLQQIGGADAEAALVEALQSTGRGVEVAYLARVLEEMAPGKHTDAALAAARDLLTNPPAIDDPSRLDESARAYLFDLLTRNGDTSFAGTAAQLLVTGEGKVDPSALRYLTQTLKDQALPALYQAYRDVRLTNLADRATLMQSALPYVGGNALANDMFKTTLNNESVNAGQRALMVQGLVYGDRFRGGPGGGGEAAAVDPAQAQLKLQFVQSLQNEVTDERVGRSLAVASQGLAAQAAGEPAPNPRELMRELFQDGQGRAGRGRGGQAPAPVPGQ